MCQYDLLLLGAGLGVGRWGDGILGKRHTCSKYAEACTASECLHDVRLSNAYTHNMYFEGIIVAKRHIYSSKMAVCVQCRLQGNCIKTDCRLLSIMVH